MRSVLYTLQRLKEQEKKQKQRELATEQVRQEKLETMKRMTEQMNNERAFMPETAGEMAIHDRMLVHQYYALCQSEEELHVQNENVQVCQEALPARQQSKTTEKTSRWKQRLPKKESANRTMKQMNWV